MSFLIPLLVTAAESPPDFVLLYLKSQLLLARKMFQPVCLLACVLFWGASKASPHVVYFFQLVSKTGINWSTCHTKSLSSLEVDTGWDALSKACAFLYKLLWVWFQSKLCFHLFSFITALISVIEEQNGSNSWEKGKGIFFMSCATKSSVYIYILTGVQEEAGIQVSICKYRSGWLRRQICLFSSSSASHD